MGRDTTLTITKRLAVVALTATASFAASCGGDKAQVFVIVDTDLPTPAQTKAEPNGFVPAAQFDRLLIQMVNEGEVGIGGREGAFAEIQQDLSIGPETPWPLTFGVKEGILGKTARIRIRAHRIENNDVIAGILLDPTPQFTVDRLAIIEVPSSGVTTIRIVLHGDCLGQPVDPVAERTCVTDPENMESARSTFERLGEKTPPPSIAGTWSRARPTPCSAPPPPNDVVGAGAAPCIPGSLDVRGDFAFTRAKSIDGYLDSGPRHEVVLSAFYMDRTEVTVGRFRGLLAKLGNAIAMPTVHNDTDAVGCTWSAQPGDSEDRSLNCLSNATARAVCKIAGGDLPTDAQWEHAARRRGLRNPFVWGDAAPTCCVARIAESLGCPVRVGPSAVGSFVNEAACDGHADISLDGIADLAGNVREITLDAALNYDDDDCPLDARPMLDPRCDSKSTKDLTARGGSFRSSFDGAKIGLRSIARASDLTADDVGFRCVYPGVAP